VAVAQVVAAPDARYTEVPAAFIQLVPGAAATEQEIIDFCLGSIATFKVPRYVRFVDEWPMSGTKVKKYVLRDQIAAELEAAGIAEAPKLSSRA
jgi:fatty-acyl-CoA synthase